MSIRAFFAACLGSICVVLVAMASPIMVAQWQDRLRAGDARELVDVLAAVSSVAESLAPERGATAAAMSDRGDGPRTVLAASRARTDTALDTAGQLLAQTGRAAPTETAAKLDRIRQRVATIRRRADADAVSGDPMRITDGKQALVEQYVELSQLFDDLNATLERATGVVDAEVANLASVAMVGWNLRDYAGRLSTLYLSAVLSGKPLASAQIREIDLARGRFAQTWEKAIAICGQPESLASLRQALETTKSTFYVPYTQVLARLDHAATGDGVYGLEATEYRRQTQPMLSASLAIRNTALAAARGRADEQRRNATNGLELAGSLLLGVAAAMAAVVHGIGMRVTVPLAALTAVITRLAGGARDFTVPHDARRDEIGSMARALEILRGNAIAADRMAQQRAADSATQKARRQHLQEVAGTFVDAIATVVGGITGSAEGVHGEMQGLTGMAGVTTEQSAAVGSAAIQASANVETVAAAAEELATSIHEIARRISEAAGVTDSAVREAEAANILIQGLSQSNPCVLHGVMKIDLQVALHLHVEIEERVLGEKRQHVVEERNARSDC